MSALSKGALPRHDCNGAISELSQCDNLVILSMDLNGVMMSLPGAMASLHDTTVSLYDTMVSLHGAR